MFDLLPCGMALSTGCFNLFWYNYNIFMSIELPTTLALASDHKAQTGPDAEVRTCIQLAGKLLVWLSTNNYCGDFNNVSSASGSFAVHDSQLAGPVSFPWPWQRGKGMGNRGGGGERVGTCLLLGGLGGLWEESRFPFGLTILQMSKTSGLIACVWNAGNRCTADRIFASVRRKGTGVSSGHNKYTIVQASRSPNPYCPLRNPGPG